ncbi:MAG: ATP-dependent Clp protease ATP-binding subunit [Bacilli bacterium]|nr:ATP-dependent Clp protease ATP-binding subunit [Bacilli bacterium]
MIKTTEIKNVLNQMTDDVQSNVKRLINLFGCLDYTDDENQSLLHILVDNIYDEEKCFLAIKSLLKCGLDPNLEADFQYNFIQTALYAGYSENFIKRVIREALKYGLKINHRDDDLDTMMHTAIYSDDYLGDIEGIYDLLVESGFDSTLVDHDSRNLVEAMIYQKQYSPEQIESFRKKFNLRLDNKPKVVSTPAVVSIPVKKQVQKISIPEEDLKELEKFGRLLNKNSYLSAPTIGREKELKNLMITLAQSKKCPLIVGESGVGKTSIVDELAYRITTGDVPKFFQGKLILEVTPSEVVAGCQYVGMFEDNMTKLMNLCEKYGIILFIDEIHTIYGVGSSKGKDNDMAAILKHYLDRTSLKVIGTTTEKEYNDYFSSDAFKRRFEKVLIKEPEDEVLFQILDKVLNDYFIKDDISLEDEEIRKLIINIIITATSKKHRVYNDVVNNPDLAISIIDKAVAFARVFDSEVITIDHFIESFDSCDRIYDSAKGDAIALLRKMKGKKETEGNKTLIIEFPKK